MLWSSTAVPEEPNFLEAMEIPLLAGRPLDARDDARAQKVVVINHAFAEKFFPGESPLGKRFSINSSAPVLTR
jgi:hypothetical protein